MDVDAQDIVALDTDSAEEQRHVRKKPRLDPETMQNGNASLVEAHANGSTSHNPWFIGNKQWINRSEYIRLIEQALINLGFKDVAELLEKESCVNFQSPSVNKFREAILSGDWDIAVKLLETLPVISEEKRTDAQFLVLEQKFLEALEQGDTAVALHCLRSELAALGVHRQRLQQLAGCILFSGKEDLQAHLDWPASPSAARHNLLVALQASIPPDVMVPEGRLEELVEQAVDSQLARCLFRNTQQVRVSLLRDYACGLEQVPSVTTQVVTGHRDEVWHLQFSHSGRWLASASKDCCAIIWDVRGRRDVARRHTLSGHTDAIAFLAWSPDDKLLATCGNDKMLKLWDTSTGRCVRTIKHHTDHVTSVAWLPDSTQFVSGGLDKQMVLWDIDGQQIRSWTGHRIHDLAVTGDGRRLLSTVADNKERKVRVYDLQDLGESALTEDSSIRSITLSPDSKFVLANLLSQHIHLWNMPAVGQPLPTLPVHKYRGPLERQGRYVLRSCFGGYNNAFVASGSEDCKVYVWHRDTEELIAVLEGHSGTVNAVSWNPHDHQMMATASDDKSIHIWSVPGGV